MWPFNNSVCQSKVRLVNKTVVITGASSGLGKETARDLYWRGARVILACRDIVKANAAAAELQITPPSKPDRDQFKGGPGELIIRKLDLCSFANIRECADLLNNTEPNINILINNAGVASCPFAKTEDGYETTWQSNHLGHFLLTLLLMPKLRDSAPARIINIASVFHSVPGTRLHFDDLNMEKSYSPVGAYNQSKLANILFTRELAQRIKDSGIDGINVYSLHPGLINTEIGRHVDITIFPGTRWFIATFLSQFLKSLESGVQTIIHCATDEQAGTETGLYYNECKVVTPSRNATNADAARRLWAESVKMIGVKSTENLIDLINIVAHR